MKDDAYYRDLLMKILTVVLAYAVFNLPGVICVLLWWLYKAGRKTGGGGS